MSKRIPPPHPRPARIVSLVPSTTESVCDLGARDRLVGVTRFCVRPDDLGGVPRVGGTKDVDVAKVLALDPDLVLANREENVAAQVAAIAAHVPVWVAHPQTVDDAVDDLRALADRLGADARPWTERIDRARAALAPWRDAPQTALAYIWRAPWMACGGDTFVSSVLAEAGLHNVVADRVRYPEVHPAELAVIQPDLVVLPSEPFPFRADHADALAAESGLPRPRFVGADGQWLTWHGTRLARALLALHSARATGWPAVGDA